MIFDSKIFPNIFNQFPVTSLSLFPRTIFLPLPQQISFLSLKNSLSLSLSLSVDLERLRFCSNGISILLRIVFQFQFNLDWYVAREEKPCLKSWMEGHGKRACACLTYHQTILDIQSTTPINVSILHHSIKGGDGPLSLFNGNDI